MNRLWKALRIALTAIVATVAIAYVGVLGYLYVNQRQMLFEAKPGHETPDIRGLAIHDIAIATPDGETLQAWYEPPQSGKPVILFLHGQSATLELGKWRYIRMHKEGVGYL
ncbi:MAG: alpha/beta hydrolase, partial [Asticcacaulis sp.]|nr:alpha/beta hydrolase [Asticcacaulis sp.]